MPRSLASRNPTGLLLTAMVCLSSGALLTGRPTAHAQPRTLYRAEDIENARRNVEQWPWAQSIVNGWKRRADSVLKHDRAFFEKLIPELTPGDSYGQTCPKCVGKKSLMGQARFKWSVTQPDRMTCTSCGTVYPNKEYPETGVLKCPRMGQTFTYYEKPEERANPEERAKHAYKWCNRPRATSFSSQIRFLKAKWAWYQLPTLAKLYALTGDIAYAERVIWILDRFARVYPNYLFHSYDGSIADWPPAQVAANMGAQGATGGPRGGRFPKETIRHAYGLHQKKDYSTLHNGFWGAGRLAVHSKGSDAGPLLLMTVAYDLVRDAKYPDGRQLVDEETDRRITNDLIAAGCTDMEHWNSLSNKGTTVFALSAAVGRLMGQPERVRRALDGFNRMMDERYHFDGFYSESPAYAAHNFFNVAELPDLLCGYSDPPDYKPKEGPRLEDLNPFKTGRFHLSLVAMMRMLAPGTRYPVIGDTCVNTRLHSRFAEVLAARLGGQYAGLLETVQGAPLAKRGSEYSLWYRPADLKADGPVALPLRSEWFPGWHVAVLRGGRKENDTALFLNGNENRWTIHSGHRHRDVLGLSYWAYGEELVSDRGYFSGSGYRLPDGRSGQSWTRGTLSHNLVVVDEKEQASRKCGSNLEIFGVAPGIEVVQASGHAVYPQCKEYRRTTALVRRPDGHTYAVDFFRVKGGKVHQYSFNCDGPLTAQKPAQPAPQPVEPAPVWSKWLSNAKAVTPQVAHTFTWASHEVSVDLMLLNTSDSVDRVIIADAPGWRRASTSELKKPPIQQVLAEHRAKKPETEIATQYAVVIVPYKGGSSPVLSARLLQNDLDSGVMAVEVKLAGRTDILVSTRDQKQRQYGQATVAGELGFVSTDDKGRAVQGYLLNGTLLACGDLKIALPTPSATLKVRSTADRTFHLAEPLPSKLPAGGSFLLACGPAQTRPDPKAPRVQTGFEIESTTADSITVRDYPVIACDEITVLNSCWLRMER